MSKSASECGIASAGLARWGFGLGNLAIGATLASAVFIGLPARSPIVDLPVIALTALMLASAGALLTRRSFGLSLLRVSALAGLVLGLGLVAALALSAAYLSGIHGDAGRRGALTLTLVMALAVPYLLLYPCVQLLWVHVERSAGRPKRLAKAEARRA